MSEKVFTFTNVTITVSADSAEEAYKYLCDQLVNGVKSQNLEYTTDQCIDEEGNALDWEEYK